jgi:hypothetical protein
VPKPPSVADRLKKIEQATAPSPALTLNLADHLFPQQLAFVQDEASFKVAMCSRRAGKSTACAADLVYTATLIPECTALYVTGARTDAKKIVWAEVKRFNEFHKLGGKANESELAMYFPNGSVIRLAGVKDDASVEKIRGQMPPVKKAYIDEAQGIRDGLLTKLIDDVLEPALLDYNGSLVMIGTPPPIPVGYFIRAFKNEDKHGNPLPEDEWSVHSWTFFDNPFIPKKSGLTHKKSFEKVLKRRGLTETDPSIRREYFGELALDTNSLVFQYTPSVNHYDEMPPGKYTYILGVDLGFNDADALAVLAWNDAGKETYLVEEVVTAQQGITELVDQIEKIRARYDISKIVMDTGGLGKKISEELIRRYKIPVQAADKARKFEHIELMNGALRTGSLRAKRSSLFASDTYKVEWDRDKTKPDKKVISDRFHSDICDAVLYAWWYSYSFTYAPEKPPPVQGSPEWLQDLEDAALEHFTALEKAEDGFGWTNE